MIWASLNVSSTSYGLTVKQLGHTTFARISGWCGLSMSNMTKAYLRFDYSRHNFMRNTACWRRLWQGVGLLANSLKQSEMPWSSHQEAVA